MVANNRSGITLLETTMMLGLLTFVASLSINIVRLGNRNFQHVRAEAYEHRQAFRFAMVLREQAHRANRAVVSKAGDELTLRWGESGRTKFSVLDKTIEMVVKANEKIIARDRFEFEPDDREWRFRVDEEQHLVEWFGTSGDGSMRNVGTERVIVAAFDLVRNVTRVAGDPDAKDG